MAKTNWKNLANYDYLGAYSLEDTPNKEVTLTIKEVKRERVTANGGSSEDCIVVYFAEKGTVDNVVVKPMVFNKTNCKIVASIYNSNFIEDWIGKKVTIYATETKFARDIVPCLRLKKEKPQEIVYSCSICGTIIDKKLYDGSIAKYGVALCGKECLEKFNAQKEENKENKEE